MEEEIDVFQDYDGLKLLVRSEVDACLPIKSGSSLDDITAALREVRLAEEKQDDERRTFLPQVKVIPSGPLISQDKLVELTTRSQRNFDSFDWKNAYPQLFFGNTPNYYIAVHRGGKFEKVHKYKLGEGHLSN